MMVHHGCVLLLQDFMHRRTLEFNMNVSKLAAQDCAAELPNYAEVKDVLDSRSLKSKTY